MTMLLLAVGYVAAFTYLGLGVAWIVDDHWVTFRDASGSVRSTGRAGLYRACVDDICLPLIPLWSPFVDNLRGLYITGLSLYGLYFLISLVTGLCNRKEWRYMWRVLGIGLAVFGLFLSSAGAVQMLQQDDMKGLITVIWKFSKTTVSVGYSAWLALVTGLAGMILGLAMSYHSHTARNGDREQAVVLRTNSIISELQTQYETETPQSDAGQPRVEQPATVFSNYPPVRDPVPANSTVSGAAQPREGVVLVVPQPVEQVPSAPPGYDSHHTYNNYP